jgi:hypothetical protein
LAAQQELPLRAWLPPALRPVLLLRPAPALEQELEPALRLVLVLVPPVPECLRPASGPALRQELSQAPEYSHPVGEWCSAPMQPLTPSAEDRKL